MDLEKIKNRVLNIKKMLESSLKIANSPDRIKNIKALLLIVNKDLEKIEKGEFTEEDEKKYEFSKVDEKKGEVNEERVVSLDILETIPKVSPSPYVRDEEIIDVNSYLAFFEREYLPILSTKYLKVIYSYQSKLDYFYSEFRRIQMLLQKFNELIENIETSESSSYISEMTKLRRKRFRELIFNMDKFFEELEEFVERILENPTPEGILLEPNLIIEIEEDENKVINHIEVIEAVKDLYRFILEVRNFLGVVNV
jgi:biopolymer transport protein ExbB/TolQ